MSFPGRLAGKESTCNAGDPLSISRFGRAPGERNGNPLQYSCPGEFHGRKSLEAFSSWVTKNQTQLSTLLHFNDVEKLKESPEAKTEIT